MKTVIIAVGFVATNAMALDFETEWAKFAPDFDRMKTVKVASVKPTSAPVIVTDRILPTKNTQDNVLEQVDPSSPDRLGYKLNDPVMRDRVTSLYKKPDTVVYSLTLTE